MPRLRVGVDARTCLGARPRGEGRSILRLYREIARLRPDWALNLYGDTPGADTPAGLAGAKISSFSVPGERFGLWENLGLPVRAAFDRIDVLHCTSSSAPPWSPAPMVVTVHDIIPLVFDDGLDEAARARFRAGIERAVRRAAVLIAVSGYTKRDLVRVLNVAPERVQVVHWGADAPAARPDAEVVRRRLEEAGIRRRYVLAFGGSARRKNTEGVIRGFAAVARADPDVDLVVAGVGAAGVRTRFANLAAELGLAQRVQVLAYVSDELIEALYAQAECLLFLSLYEGFGLPVLEAMAHGVPVLASNTTSIPEVAGDAALLVDPQDTEAWTTALLEMVQRPSVKLELSKRGEARAGQFTWHHAALGVIELLETTARA